MEIRRNSNGSILAVCGGVERIAAHCYMVKSNSAMDGKYFVYVESISPRVVRCQCKDHIVTGKICKHGEAALEVEKFVAKWDPEQFREERRLQKERKEQGRLKRPYRGSRQDELRKQA